MEPIPGNNAVGEDLIAKSDKTWAELDENLKAKAKDEIRELEILNRPSQATEAEGDKSRPSAVSPEPKTVVAWDKLLEKLEEILKTRCKHLRLGSQWMAAALFQEGITGLRKGLQLNRELIRRYWNSIHPQPQESLVKGDKDPRATGLRQGANSLLIVERVKFSPLIPGTPEPSPSWAQLRGVSGSAERQRLEVLSQQVPRPVLEDLRAEANQSIEELAGLVEDLQAHCEEADVSTISSNWDDLLMILGDQKRIIESLIPSSEPSAGGLADGKAEPSTAAPSGSVGAGKVLPAGSRDEAFGQLRKLSAFFARSEPHSPLSAAIEELVRWEKLPFADLMKRLVEDETALARLYLRTGVETRTDENDNPP